MIKRLIVFDFDATLMDTPMPENGKQAWEDATGEKYPHKGWWGRPESLDLDVFDIKPFPTVLAQLKEESSKPDTSVIILTSRQEKLRPYIQAILDANNIKVDRLDMKKDEKTKGEKILEYVKNLPDLEEISVYDDRSSEIESYRAVRNDIPSTIAFNIYLANEDRFALVENKITDIIQEEIQKLIHGYL